MSKRHHRLVQRESNKQPSSVIAFVTVRCPMCLERAVYLERDVGKLGAEKNEEHNRGRYIKTNAAVVCIIYRIVETCR